MCPSHGPRITWLYSIMVLPGNRLLKCTRKSPQGIASKVLSMMEIHASCSTDVAESVGASINAANIRVNTKKARNCPELILPPSKAANHDPPLLSSPHSASHRICPVRLLPSRFYLILLGWSGLLPSILPNTLLFGYGLRPGIHHPKR